MDEPEVLRHRQAEEDASTLGNVRDAQPRAGARRDATPDPRPSKRRPAMRLDDPGDHAQRRRLAGAVGAEQRRRPRPRRPSGRHRGPRPPGRSRRSGPPARERVRAQTASTASRPAAALPRYASITCSVTPDLVRRARTRSPSRTRGRRRNREIQSTSPMSWSTSSIDVPASTTSRSRRPEFQALGRCPDPPPARPDRSAAARQPAPRATPTSLRCPCDKLGRHRVGERCEPEKPSAASAAVVRPNRHRQHLLHRRAKRRPVGRHDQVLAHGEIVEQLDRLPRPRQPATERARAERSDVIARRPAPPARDSARSR